MLFNFVFNLTILSALIYPTKGLNDYFTLLILLSTWLLILKEKKIIIDKTTVLIISPYFLIIFSSLFTSIYFSNTQPRNITEIIRWLPIILLLLNSRLEKISLKHILMIFIIYSGLAFLVSIMQYMGNTFFINVGNIYSSEKHLSLSLGISSRALGLSSGPGTNGAISSTLYAIYLSIFLQKKYLSTSIIGISLSIGTVLLSQSQTAFLACIGVTLFALFYTIFSSKNKIKATVKVLIISISFLYASFLLIEENFRYLRTLFTLGLERSSFQSRTLKVEEVLSLISDNSFFFLFGHGKDYFGELSGHMDNEYLFILAVYGFFTLISCIFLYIYVITKPLTRKATPSFITLSFIFVCGSIIAWPSSFLLDPRIAVLITIFFHLSKNKYTT